MTEQALQHDGTLVEYTDDEMVRVSRPETQAIIDWCYEHDIESDLLWVGYLFGHRSTWGIKNEQHRTMFALRWV
jgi:hypothetical protein